MKIIFYRIIAFSVTMILVGIVTSAHSYAQDRPGAGEARVILASHPAGSDTAEFRRWLQSSGFQVTLTIVTALSSHGVESRELHAIDLAWVMADFAGDDVMRASTFVDYAFYYSYVSEEAKARAYAERALKLHTAKDTVVLGLVSEVFGDLALYKSDYDTAEREYRRALACHTASDQTTGIGMMHKRLGEIEYCRGRLDSASARFMLSLDFFEKSNSAVGRANSYFGLADIRYRLGETAEARALYLKALDFFVAAGDRDLGHGNVYEKLGGIAYDEGNLMTADSLFRIALGYFKTARSRIGQSSVSISLGDIAFLNGSAREAELYWKTAKSSYQRTEDASGLASVLQRMALLASERKDIQAALALNDSACSIFTRLGETYMLALALFDRGRICIIHNRIEEAYAALRRAADMLETLRANAGSPESRGSLLDKLYISLDAAAILFLRQGDADAALRFSETIRARVFLDRYVEHAQKTDLSLPSSIRTRRDSLEALRAGLQSGIGNAFKRRQIMNADSLASLLKAVNESCGNLLEEIRHRHPGYADIVYPKPVSLATLRNEVLRQGETLLEYHVGDMDSYALAISRDSAVVRRLGIGRRELRLAVSAQTGSFISKIESADNLLYSKLIGPVEDFIEGASRLIIVPDDELASLPFESLRAGGPEKEGGSKYLLENHDISYIQSATALALLRSSKPVKREPSLLAFGDPVYDYAGFERSREKECVSEYELSVQSKTGLANAAGKKALARELMPLCALKFSRAEIDSIAGLFPGRRLVFTRENALEDIVKSRDWCGHTHVLFSCHGIAGRDFNGLLLTLDSPSSREDGFLSWQEAMNCNFNADLIVLSACQTGKGELRRGEGMTGMMRSMMIAGSRSVLASLWNVNDEAAAKLTTSFFRGLMVKGQSASEALRFAKLELLNSRVHAAPYYWAPFVIYGE